MIWSITLENPMPTSYSVTSFAHPWINYFCAFKLKKIIFLKPDSNPGPPVLSRSALDCSKTLDPWRKNLSVCSISFYGEFRAACCRPRKRQPLTSTIEIGHRKVLPTLFNWSKSTALFMVKTALFMTYLATFFTIQLVIKSQPSYSFLTGRRLMLVHAIDVHFVLS